VAPIYPMIDFKNKFLELYKSYTKIANVSYFGIFLKAFAIMR